jgi:hypothetical protein
LPLSNEHVINKKTEIKDIRDSNTLFMGNIFLILNFSFAICLQIVRTDANKWHRHSEPAKKLTANQICAINILIVLQPERGCKRENIPSGKPEGM